MIENLPDLASLSDAELKNLRQQSQDETLKALDVLGTEIGSGRLSMEEAGKQGDQLVHLMTTQQEIFFNEQMRRSALAHRKKRFLIIAVAIATGLGALALFLLKQNSI